MSVRLFVALLARVSLTGFAPAPKPRPPKGPDPKEVAKNMQGTWQLVGSDRAGFKGKVAIRSTRQVRIDGNTWQYVYNTDALGGAQIRPTTSYNIILDTSKSPVTMDLKRSTTNSVYISGIVTVEGDTMKF